MKKVIHYLASAVLAAFGLLTLFLSTSVIFDLFGIRAKEGNYVLFVVWSNFISSFLYLIAVYGLLASKNWTYKTLGLSAALLTATFVGFLFYIQSGGIHEAKTVGAMVFRIALTLTFALFAYFTINKRK
ncbi:MAG: hypothetical protein RIB71_01020 [Imperialibacter sp.]|uniref:hypothetical protein n=1 Tax=Imperialibacter sp. TaxID=2038411 RepID=UPI0032F0077B